MKKTAFLVMIITVVSKLLGFGREIVMSYMYGASAITDAFIVSQTIPVSIFSFVGIGIATGFVPMYSRILKEHGKAEVHRFTSNVINALLLLASVIVFVVFIFAEPITRVFAVGFSGEVLKLASEFAQITVFGVYITALLYVFTAYLRLNGSFVVPALMGLPTNVIIICSLLLSSRTSVYVLVVGSVLASGAHLALLIPSIRKTGYRHGAILKVKDVHIKTMVVTAIPVIIGDSINQINSLIDRTIASNIVVGGISALNYANRINGFVHSLFVVSITTVIYPVISKIAAAGKTDSFRGAIAEALSMVNLLVVPATLGAMVFSEEIVRFLFGRGAFSQEAIAMTAKALFFYSPGMVAFGTRDILSRAFYALQDTRTPMINSSIGVAINIGLNIVLSRYLGIGGLALATSVAGIISSVLLFIALRRKIGRFGLRAIITSFLKVVVASSLMGVICYSCFHIFLNLVSRDIALLISIGVGALVYAVMIFLLKIPEVERTVEILRSKLEVMARKRG